MKSVILFCRVFSGGCAVAGIAQILAEALDHAVDLRAAIFLLLMCGCTVISAIRK